MTTVAVQRQAQRRRSPLVGYLLRRAGTEDEVVPLDALEKAL